MNIIIPEDAVVMMVGPAASGKSTFVLDNFPFHQRVSSDVCRRMVADDPSDMSANQDAFEVFHDIIEKRVKRGLRTFADATHLKKFARDNVIEIAEKYRRPVIAVLVDPPEDEETHLTWNTYRDRVVPEQVIMKHRLQYESAKDLVKKDPRILRWYNITPDTNYRIETEKGHTAAGWDVIGDVHGCYTELMNVLLRLGYRLRFSDSGGTGDTEIEWYHPEGRRLAFVGDLTDRGPHNIPVVQLVMSLVDNRMAVVVEGNHDNKFKRYMRGNPVTIAHGLQRTVNEFKDLPEEEKQEISDFFESLPTHVSLYTNNDTPPLVVAHAGIDPDQVGRTDSAVESRCLYGKVTRFEDGVPVRDHSWTKEWEEGDDKPFLVYGHTRHDTPLKEGNSVCVDTGCFSGGALTAFRWPEQSYIRVEAQRDYTQDEWEKAA